MTGPPPILRRPETTGEYLDLVRDRARELFGLHDRGPEDGGAGWGISVGFPPRHERSPGTSERSPEPELQANAVARALRRDYRTMLR
jgi:hypothetical protein